MRTDQLLLIHSTFLFRPSGESLGETIRIVAGMDDPTSGYAELVCRPESADTIDADSRTRVDVEDLALAAGSIQASRREIL